MGRMSPRTLSRSAHAAAGFSDYRLSCWASGQKGMTAASPSPAHPLAGLCKARTATQAVPHPCEHRGNLQLGTLRMGAAHRRLCQAYRWLPNRCGSVEKQQLPVCPRLAVTPVIGPAHALNHRLQRLLALPGGADAAAVPEPVPRERDRWLPIRACMHRSGLVPRAGPSALW